eukprot:407424-Rhodomonas_salina.2
MVQSPVEQEEACACACIAWETSQKTRSSFVLLRLCAVEPTGSDCRFWADVCSLWIMIAPMIRTGTTASR